MEAPPSPTQGRPSIATFAVGVAAGLLLALGVGAAIGLHRTSQPESIPAPATQPKPIPAPTAQPETQPAQKELSLSESDTLARLNSNIRQLGASHEWVRDDPSTGVNVDEKDLGRIIGIYVFGDTLEIESAIKIDIIRKSPSGDVSAVGFRYRRIRLPLNGEFAGFDLKVLELTRAAQVVKPGTPNANVFCSITTLSLNSEQKNIQLEEGVLATPSTTPETSYVPNTADNAGNKNSRSIYFPLGFSKQIQWLRARAEHDFVPEGKIDLLGTDSANKALVLEYAKAIAHLISLHGGKIALNGDVAAASYPPLAGDSKGAADSLDTSNSDDPGSPVTYLKVQSVISATDGEVTSLDYLATWMNQRVVVDDTLCNSKFAPGDWIPVIVSRTASPPCIHFSLGVGSFLEPMPKKQ